MWPDPLLEKREDAQGLYAVLHLVYTRYVFLLSVVTVGTTMLNIWRMVHWYMFFTGIWLVRGVEATRSAIAL